MVPSGAVSLGSPTTCIAPYARVCTSADSSASLICQHFCCHYIVDSRFGTLLGYSRLSALKSLSYFRYHIAAIGHVDDVDAGFLTQQLAGEVMGGADAGGAILQLARVRLGIGDELHHRIDRQVDMDGEADDVRAGVGNGREVLHRVERRIFVEKDVAGH